MIPGGAIHLSSGAAATIARAAAAAHPRESGGLLLGARGERTAVHAAIPLPNRAADAVRAYEADPADVLRAAHGARALRLDIVGTFHSHPDASAVPSTADGDAAWPGGITVLVPVNAGGPGSPRAWLRSIAAEPPRWFPLRIDGEPVSSPADDVP